MFMYIIYIWDIFPLVFILNYNGWKDSYNNSLHYVSIQGIIYMKFLYIGRLIRKKLKANYLFLYIYSDVWILHISIVCNHHPKPKCATTYTDLMYMFPYCSFVLVQLYLPYFLSISPPEYLTPSQGQLQKPARTQMLVRHDTRSNIIWSWVSTSKGIKMLWWFVWAWLICHG